MKIPEETLRKQHVVSRSLLMPLEILLQVLREVVCLHGHPKLPDVFLKLLGTEQHTEEKPCIDVR